MTADPNQPASGADEMPQERREAIALASKLLDEPNCDPDDDLRVLSRQLLRVIESAAHPTPEREASIQHPDFAFFKWRDDPNQIRKDAHAAWIAGWEFALSAQSDKPVAQVDVEGLLLIVERLRSEAFLHQGARHEEISRIMLKGMAERGLLAAPSGKGDAEPVSPLFIQALEWADEKINRIPSEWPDEDDAQQHENFRTIIRAAATPPVPSAPPEMVMDVSTIDKAEAWIMNVRNKHSRNATGGNDEAILNCLRAMRCSARPVTQEPEEDIPCVSCGKPSQISTDDDAEMCFECHAGFLGHEYSEALTVIGEMAEVLQKRMTIGGYNEMKRVLKDHAQIIEVAARQRKTQQTEKGE